VITCRRLSFVALAGLLATRAHAQNPTEDAIKQGIAAYENFQVERARPLFKQIISPGYPYQVTDSQRVTAYKYLGASYAVLSIADSAITYFSAALDYDPFTDLDAANFSASELGPFAIAKTKVFKIGIRPIYSAVVNPRVDSTAYVFQLVSTHKARMTVELIRQPDGNLKESLFDGDADGPRPIKWDGLMRSTGGKIADSATYILRVSATDAGLPAGQAAGPAITSTLFLKVEHSYEPLEDSLPTLTDSMLLADRIPSAAPWFDLAKGVMVGVAAYAFPAVLLSSDVSWQVHAIVGSVAGIASGAGSFLYRSKKREIPGNVTENRRRQQQRADFNAGVKARNDQRIARTKLIITPLKGA